MVEYAWLAKPIVNITRLEQDSSQEFLSDYPALLTLRDRGNDSADEDAYRLEEFLNGIPYHIDRDYLIKLRNKHCAESITDQYSRLMRISQLQEAAAL